MVKYVAGAICCVAFFAQHANAQSCRHFGKEARDAIGAHVAALQRIEHEASDRLKGLDSRPFDFLLGEARRVTAIIADPAALEREKELERCRNRTTLIRKMCAGAAEMLVEILDKHRATEKPEYDKPPYATAMAACEQAMGHKELKSLIRGTG
jgi:hypothetical protein